MRTSSRDAPARRVAPAPRRLAAAVPVFVIAATLALIAWSAWPVLRPAREVTVTQAVLDRSTQAADPSPGARTARNAPGVQAPGWLEAEPYYIACTALADGVVESIEVLEGEFVERGAVVARLVAEDSQLRLARAEAALARARADVVSARAEHDAAERSWEDPVALERALGVARAELAEREAELAQLPALIGAARATLSRLDEQARRVRRSTEQGATNELERIIADQRAAAQRAQVEAIEQRRPILAARVERLGAEVRAARRDLALRIEVRRRLDAAAAALTGAQAAARGAKAARDEAALELSRMVVRAPVSGYIQERLKVPGDKVMLAMDNPESAHLAHIYDHASIQVRVDVPLADAARVSVGQACEVIVEVLPDTVFRGEVLRVLHEADLQKNTLEIKVKVFDPDPILRPEMLTRVKFLAAGESAGSADAMDARSQAPVLVPLAAIDNAGGAARVWVVTGRRGGRGVLTPVTITVAERSDGWARVSGDLSPGALLAVDLVDPEAGERVVVRAASGEGAPS